MKLQFSKERGLSMDTKKEEWKEIPGYESLYEASSFGRIRTCNGKTTFTEWHGIRVWKSRILKNKTKTPDDSGFKVSLWKNGEAKTWLVHRLCALTFLGEPQNIELKSTGERMTVNHKDGNRLNNNIENLEWLTLADNIRHAFDNGFINTSYKTKIIIDKNVIEFSSMTLADKYIGRANGYISNAIANKRQIKDIQGRIVKIVPF